MLSCGFKLDAKYKQCAGRGPAAGTPESTENNEALLLGQITELRISVEGTYFTPSDLFRLVELGIEMA